MRDPGEDGLVDWGWGERGEVPVFVFIFRFVADLEVRLLCLFFFFFFCISFPKDEPRLVAAPLVSTVLVDAMVVCSDCSEEG